MDAYAYDAFGYKVSWVQATANPYHYVGGLGYYSGMGGPSVEGPRNPRGLQDRAPILIHVGARYYAPDIGRFITADPIGYGGGMNLYGYVGNNPPASE